MSAPPGTRPNAARHADRNGRIFQLKIAGLTERAIAAEVGLSQTRVHEILVEEIGARVGPPAEEYVALREAELADLWSKVYRIALTADDPADRIKAIETAKRINESRRKLRGADAPQALSLQLEAREELDATIVTGAILGTLDDIFRALPDLDTRHRDALRGWALERAQAHVDAMTEDADGAPPAWTEPPRPQLALPPGPSDSPPPSSSPHAWPTGPDDPPRRSHDSAEAVLDALADFEETYGGLDAEDDT